jgi:hypothetical protein
VRFIAPELRTGGAGELRYDHGMIPAATIHGPRWRAIAARRDVKLAAWAVTLGATQALLLSDLAPSARAAVGVGLAMAAMAAVIAATVWFLRVMIPVAPRAIGVAAIVLLYGAVALRFGGDGRFAVAILAPAIIWALWLPRQLTARRACPRCADRRGRSRGRATCRPRRRTRAAPGSTRRRTRSR